MLSVESSVLVVIDIQGRLAQLMDGKEALFDNAARMTRGAKVLGVPIVWAEQNPKGLGPTIPQIAELMADMDPIPKMTFSCCGEERITARLEELGRKQAILTGIETHVCVYQTAMSLLGTDHEVHVVADAVSSRKRENKEIALRRMEAEGVKLSSVEMALFELMKTATADGFRDIVEIVK